MFAFQIQYASEVVLLETFNWHCEQQSIWWNIMERSHSSEGNLIKQNVIRTHKGNFNWQLLIIYFIKENQLVQHNITWDAEVPAGLCDLERRDGSRPRQRRGATLSTPTPSCTTSDTNWWRRWTLDSDLIYITFCRTEWCACLLWKSKSVKVSTKTRKPKGLVIPCQMVGALLHQGSSLKFILLYNITFYNVFTIWPCGPHMTFEPHQNLNQNAKMHWGFDDILYWK